MTAAQAQVLVAVNRTARRRYPGVLTPAAWAVRIAALAATTAVVLQHL